MIKKGISIIIAAIIAFSICGPVCAYAAEETVIVDPAEAYFQDESLYVFSRISDTGKLDDVSVDIVIDDVLKAQDVPLLPVMGSESWIHYFLLLDVPQDMENYSWRHAQEFAETLLQNVKQPTMVSMAVMGTSEIFAVTPKNEREVAQVMVELKHNASNASRREVWEAGMQYCAAFPRQPGELLNLVLLTPHTAHDTDSLEEDVAWLEQMNPAMPDKIHHLVHLETPNPKVQAGEGFGAGIHAVVRDMGSAKKTAEGMAENVNSLFYLSLASADFSDTTEKRNVQLITSFANSTDMEIATIDQVPVVASGEWIPIETIPEVPEETEPSEATEPAEETVPTEETEPAAEPTSPVTPVLQPDAPEMEISTAVIVAAAVGGVLLVAVLAVALKGKKKPKPHGDAIPMRLEIVSGKCKTSQRKFYLTDELFIGSGKTCDVVIKDRSIAAKSCRIFTDGQFIWIEDLNEKSNTSIDGMKIYAPNRLRSGSKLTMGNTCIRFLF